MSFDKHQNANKGTGTDINKNREKELNRLNQNKPTQDKSNLGTDKARQGGHQDTSDKGRMDK